MNGLSSVHQQVLGPCLQGSLTQSETKLVSWCNVGFVKVAVVNIEAFGKIVVPGSDSRSVVRSRLRDSV